MKKSTLITLLLISLIWTIYFLYNSTINIMNNEEITFTHHIDFNQKCEIKIDKSKIYFSWKDDKYVCIYPDWKKSL